jgi:hypothetical protein
MRSPGRACQLLGMVAALALPLSAAAQAEPPITTRNAPVPEPEPPSPPLKLFLGGAFGLLQNILPHLAPFGALSVGLMNRDFYSALRLGYAPRQLAHLSTPQGSGGHVSLANAAVEAGLRLHALVEIPLLAGVEAGVLVARGTGPMTEPATQVADWLAGYLGTGLAFSWSERWRISLRLDGLVALRRTSFALDTDTGARFVFHRPSLLSLRMYLMIELYLQ